jgi:predicted transcriptional regulator
VPEARLRVDNPPASKAAVGPELRKVRLSLNLSLHDVASGTGYTVAFIGRMERSTTAPSENVTNRILRALLSTA